MTWIVAGAAAAAALPYLVIRYRGRKKKLSVPLALVPPADGERRTVHHAHHHSRRQGRRSFTR